LELADTRITKIPSDIRNIPLLDYLGLSGNRITDFSGVKNFTRLTKLMIDNNRLTSVPREILEIPRLQELILTDNQLTQLPDELIQLTSLQKLNVDNNQLTTLPRALLALPNLRIVEARHNNIDLATQQRIQTALPNVEFHF